ncbi:MAG TPA: polysaccharide deacetylase family protein [Candidatus Ozemobacteraceae bacterium]|nr:polysaccharide deacetylase family protein [Candidatus Ozemobacteraceae bacterium]
MFLFCLCWVSSILAAAPASWAGKSSQVSAVRETAVSAPETRTGSQAAGQSSPIDPSIPRDIVRDFEVLRQQLAQHPRDVAILNSLGILYARVGQLNDALSVWQRALEYDPRYVHLYNNIGSALKTQKRFAEARQVFQRGLQVAPSYWIHYNLGLLEKELGRLADAAICFQMALRMNPKFEPAQQKMREIAAAAAGYPVDGNSSMRTELPFPFEVKPPVSVEGTPQTEDAEDEDQGPPVRRWGGTNRGSSDVGPVSTVAECVAVLGRHQPGRFGKTIALTFDDGPHPSYTTQLLEYLRSQGVRATFFVLGSRAETYPHLITRMSDEGHELANHTWSHRSLVNQSQSAALSEMRRTSELLSGLTGRSPRLVRPPYGHTNAKVARLIHGQGWHQIMWDADSRDWAGGSSQAMLQRVMRQFSPGGIVLFHDIHPGMLRVLPVLIPALKQCGYRFVTVSELMALDPAS